jgi:hypothetical protein
MKDHDFAAYFVLAIYGFIFLLILWNIELRLHPLGRIKCKFGHHKRKFKKLGEMVSQYRCERCGKPKDHPHLKVIDGGKKDLDITFRF